MTMKKYKNNNKGFVAPAGAIIAALVALGVIGTGVAYQYSTHNSLSRAGFGFGASNNNVQRQVQYGHGRADGHGPNMSEDEFIKMHEQEMSGFKTQSISSEEKEDLLFMREEEKLARDVYITLYKKWGERVFDNISRSESRHALAIKSLLDKYQIKDPVTNDSVGVFQNSELQKLYNDLTTKGVLSLKDALVVGATVEDVDIRDLHNAIARTDNDDIKFVYENLMRGSRNHMRSFYSSLKRVGGDYKAQYISQDELEQIINSDIERGNHGGAGANSQHGFGNGRGRAYGNWHSAGDDGVQMQKWQGGYGQGHGRGNGQGMGRGRWMMDR